MIIKDAYYKTSFIWSLLKIFIDNINPIKQLHSWYTTNISTLIQFVKDEFCRCLPVSVHEAVSLYSLVFSTNKWRESARKYYAKQRQEH